MILYRIPRNVWRAKSLLLIVVFLLFLGLPSVALCLPPVTESGETQSTGDPIGGERMIPIPKFGGDDAFHQDPIGQTGAAWNPRGFGVIRPVSPFVGQVWIIIPGVPGVFTLPAPQSSLWGQTSIWLGR
jgi:hypothetical protein